MLWLRKELSRGRVVPAYICFADVIIIAPPFTLNYVQVWKINDIVIKTSGPLGHNLNLGYGCGTNPNLEVSGTISLRKRCQCLVGPKLRFRLIQEKR